MFLSTNGNIFGQLLIDFNITITLMRGGILRRVIITTIQIRKLLLCIVFFSAFIIILSIFIVGIGSKGGNIKGEGKGTDKYSLNEDGVVFNNNNEPKIKVYITKERKIKVMNLEDYVRGVVSAEMPAKFGIEALKAQAVAARTYALAHMEEFGGTKSSYANGGDVCDTVNCQAYMGKDERFALWPDKDEEEYWKKITRAVEETAGQIITYENKLVMDPLYFAVSSGKTESAAEVFAIDRPYLISVKSDGDENAPNYKTSKSYSYSQLANLISSKYPKAGVTSSKLKNQVSILERSPDSGIVKKMKLGNVTIEGSMFREMTELNSANFKISFNSKDVVISCTGSGHDVGMSQWGADAMAKSGNSYEQILTHYYHGVKVSTINDLR